MLNDTVVVAGAGLSGVAGLPTMRLLTKSFFNLATTDATADRVLQSTIFSELKMFWSAVFG